VFSPKGGSGYSRVQMGGGCGGVVVVEIGTGSGEMGVCRGESGGSDVGVGVVVSICWFCANACAVSCDLGEACTRVGCGVIARPKESME